MTRRPLRARLGFVGYIGILALIQRTPRSIRSIVALAGIAPSAGPPLLAGMRAVGLIHIAGWEQGENRPTVPKYLAGIGEEPPPPTTRPNGKPCGRPRQPSVQRPRSELIAFANFLRALESPITKTELAEHCGMSPVTARLALRALADHKMVRVSGWVPAGGGAFFWSATWQLGRGRDAPKPDPMSQSEIQARYRAARRSRESAMVVTRALTQAPSLEAA